MAPPSPLPTFVYKIVPTAPPEPLPAAYPLSELDQKDGFVHLSTSWQVPITCDLFFKDATEIWILKLKLDNFANNTKWDQPATDSRPHLFGNFGAVDVESGERFVRTTAQTWAEVFATQEWLQ